ncbi:DUF397 domain-containing protein [Streptomyces sp. NPDC091281]|uniref:DUF397 domain-containing protein n=1 Tax=Streptomyces sp. NPDC091281 TaxID=3365985 RepID=UPI003829D1E0
MKPDNPQWRTSSYSDNGGTCVEVATNLVAKHGTVRVRDSKNVNGPVVDVTADAFLLLISAVREGR